MNILRSRSPLVAAAILVTVAACARSAGPGPYGDAGRYAFDQLNSRADARHVVRPYRDLSELLPNVRFKQPGSKAAPILYAAALGHIVDMTPGRAYADSEGREEVPFDSADAMWRTVHLEVHIDEALGGADLNDDVNVGLAISGTDDPNRIATSLKAAGQLLLLLDDGGPVFDYDPDLLRFAEDGGLIATVAPDGKIRLPAAEDEAALLGSIHTLKELRRAAAKPGRVIPMTGLGERADSDGRPDLGAEGPADP